MSSASASMSTKQQTVDKSSTPVNKNLAKSRAYAAKTREAIEDGTVAKERKEKAKLKVEDLKGLVDWELERLEKSTEIADGPGSLKTKLELVAKDRGQVHLSSSFFEALDRYKDADTAQWLESYLASPYTTSPNHPALRLSTLPADGEDVFHVYYRAYETTVKDEKARLEGFLDRYPGYNWLIAPKLKLLDQLSPSSTIWSHYIGQTMREVEKRQQEDNADSSAKSFMVNWLEFTKISYKIYEFLAFKTPKPESFTGTEKDLWLASPHLWEYEYGLVLASRRASLNSAPGGLPQVVYQPSEIFQKIADLTHASLDPPSVMTVPVEEDQDPSVTTVPIEEHQERLDRPPLMTVPFEEDQERLEMVMKAHYREMKSTFVQRGLISEDALQKAVYQATNVVFDSQFKTSGLLLVCKDVTRQDAEGLSDWWNDYSGLAPKLWRRLWQTVSRTEPPGDDRHLIAGIAAMINMWCVTLVHKEVILACIFLCRTLCILRPRLICVMSDKVTTLLQKGYFDEPGINLRAPLKTLKEIWCAKTLGDPLEQEPDIAELEEARETDPIETEPDVDMPCSTIPASVVPDVTVIKDNFSASEEHSDVDMVEVKGDSSCQSEHPAKPTKGEGDFSHVDPVKNRPKTGSQKQKVGKDERDEASEDDDGDGDHGDGEDGGDGDGEDDSDEDETDHDESEDDDEEGDLEWDLSADGAFIKRAGSIEVVQLGLGRHYSVVVSMLDPGHFAYNPAYQRHLYELFLCQTLLVYIVKKLGESSPATWSQATAQDVQQRAQKLSIDTGLDSYLTRIKEELVPLVHAMESIKNLSRIRTVEHFDQLSARMQEVRQDVIAKQIPAKGDPWSDEREAQIEALGIVGLLNDVDIDPSGASDTVEERKALWTSLFKVRKGRYLGLSVNSQLGKAKAKDQTHEGLKKARSAIDHVKKTKTTAEAGVWPGYSGNNNPTLEEALAWVTGATEAGLTGDRTSLKSPNSLLVCHCTKCGADGLVRMNTQRHFCLIDGEYQKGYSIVAKDSAVEYWKVVIPINLYHGAFESEFDALIEGKYKVAYRDDEVAAITPKGVKFAKAWEMFQLDAWEDQWEKPADADYAVAVKKLDKAYHAFLKEL